MRSFVPTLRALALLGPVALAPRAEAQRPPRRPGGEPVALRNHRSCPRAQPTAGDRCGGAVVSQLCSYPDSAQLCTCAVHPGGRRWSCQFTGIGPTEGPLPPPELASA